MISAWAKTGGIKMLKLKSTSVPTEKGEMWDRWANVIFVYLEYDWGILLDIFHHALVKMSEV